MVGEPYAGDHSGRHAFKHGTIEVTPGHIILSKTSATKDNEFSQIFRHFFGKSVLQMQNENIKMALAGFTYDPKICNFKFGSSFKLKLFNFQGMYRL